MKEILVKITKQLEALTAYNSRHLAKTMALERDILRRAEIQEEMEELSIRMHEIGDLVKKLR